MVTENYLMRLLSLQEVIHEKIILENNIREIPKQLSTQEELLARLKKTFIDKNQEYEKIKAEETDLKGKLWDAESTREKAEKHMENISTQREYELLDKEIKDAKEKEQQYRRDVQQRERYLAELDEQIKQHTALIEQQEKDLEERRKKIDEENADKLQQLSVLRKKEEELTEDIDPEMVFKFERIIKNKKGKGIVAIKGNVCMGCFMILPVQFANEVRIGEQVVFCPYCSRVMYYEDSTEDAEEYFNIEDTGSLSDLDDIEDEDYDEEDEEEEFINIDSETD